MKQSFCIILSNLICPETKQNQDVSGDLTGKGEGLWQ